MLKAFDRDLLFGPLTVKVCMICPLKASTTRITPLDVETKMFLVSGEKDSPLSSVPRSHGILKVEKGP